MVTICYESPYAPRKYDHYTFVHTAKTILILAGYLPSDEDEDTYINLYTRETARLSIRK